MKKWLSIADWGNFTHDTKEQAESICRMLERDGFGGSGKSFPKSTKVVEIKDNKK